MLRFRIVVILLLCSFALNLAKVRINGVRCKHNGSVCAPGYCVLIKTHGTNNYLSSGCNFIKPVKPMMVHLRLLRKVKNKYETYNVDLIYNLCDLYKTVTSNPIANYMISSSMKYAKNLHCPMMGNVTLDHMPLMLFFVQAMLPPTDYLTDAHVYDNDGYILNLTVSFTVTQRLY